jgi:hypothetical protein
MSGVTTCREVDGCSQSESEVSAPSAPVEARPLSLDEVSISQLRQFFELLDELDRKAAEQTDDEDPSSTKAMQAAGGA